MITTVDFQGVPKEPTVPSFHLTFSYYRAREIDPIIAQASQKFIDDENFVKSKAFAQFLWRKNIGHFKTRCKSIKIEQLSKLDSEIEEEVKAKFMEDFT